MGALEELGSTVKIETVPNEIAEPTRFELDETHRSYDPEAANLFRRVLVQSARFFAHGSAGSAVRCISSGEASIWR